MPRAPRSNLFPTQCFFPCCCWLGVASSNNLVCWRTQEPNQLRYQTDCIMSVEAPCYQPALKNQENGSWFRFPHLRRWDRHTLPQREHFSDNAWLGHAWPDAPLRLANVVEPGRWKFTQPEGLQRRHSGLHWFNFKTRASSVSWRREKRINPWFPRVNLLSCATWPFTASQQHIIQPCAHHDITVRYDTWYLRMP